MGCSVQLQDVQISAVSGLNIDRGLGLRFGVLGLEIKKVCHLIDARDLCRRALEDLGVRCAVMQATFFFLWLHARFTSKCVMGYPTEILPNITDMFGDGRSRSACGGTGPIFGM